MRNLLPVLMLFALPLPSLAGPVEAPVIDVHLELNQAVINDAFAPLFLEEISLTGTVALPEASIGAALGDGRRPVNGLFDATFDLTMSALVREAGVVAPLVDLEFLFNNDNAALAAPFAPLYLNGNFLQVDGTGLAPFTPLLDLTADRANTPLAFPNGKRFGDDVTDQLVIQLFRGSVNLGVAAFLEPNVFPSVLAQGQLSADDILTIGSLAPVPVPVPAPPAVPLFVAALVTLLSRSRYGRWTVARR